MGGECITTRKSAGIVSGGKKDVTSLIVKRSIVELALRVSSKILNKEIAEDHELIRRQIEKLSDLVC